MGNFEEHPPEQVARDICLELDRCVPDHLAAGRYFRQLRVLAQLRNLNLNFLSDMESIASFFSEEKDVFYIKGEKRGIKKGMTQSKKVFVQNLLAHTDFSVEKIAALADVTVDFVQQQQIQAEKL